MKIDTNAPAKETLEIPDFLRRSNSQPDELTRDSVALVYGLLWHINNCRPGYDAPADYSRPQLTPEKAAYMARHILRGKLTNEERGEGINKAALIANAEHYARMMNRLAPVEDDGA